MSRSIRMGAAALGLGLAPTAVRAAVLAPDSYFQESGGVVAGEAENYHSRTVLAANNATWKISPTEVVNPGDNAQAITNARGGQYVQALPDGGGNSGGPNNPPTISYRVNIETAGTYQLYLRWETNANNTGASDSMFADIVELKDGTSGPNTIADWYEYGHPGSDSNFSTNPWDGLGGKEENVATAANNPAVWTIATPGIYTVRLSVREDGAAVDAWALQLQSLVAPTGTGPAESAIVPEPGTLGLLGLGALGMLARRRGR